VGAAQNGYGDVLFTIFKMDEIRRGAAFFHSFLLNGTWFLELASYDASQASISEIFENPNNMWLSWTSMILTNGFCPRVQMIVFVIRVALEIGPLVATVPITDSAETARKRQRKVHSRQREFYLDAFGYKNPHSRNGWLSALRARTIAADKISRGKLDPKQCHEITYFSKLAMKTTASATLSKLDLEPVSKNSLERSVFDKH
jgi:hypothetical protein